MDIKFNRALLFDGSYALHRALSEPHNWEMKNSQGKRTGGIFGVLRTIAKEFKTYNYFPIVVFDGGLSSRRLNIYPNYKRAQEKALLENKEEKTEEELLDEEFRREYNTQRNDLIQLLPLFGIPVLYAPGWEGDDLLYILSKISKDSIVVSDDKDLIQLIYEDENRRCRIRRPLRDEFLDMQSIKDRGINIKEYVACKSIIGDPSDNIPSACFQVGEKTSLGLYKLYEQVVNNNISFPKDEKELTELCTKYNIPKRKAYLNFNEDQFLLNYSLTDLTLVDNDISEDQIKIIFENLIKQFVQFADKDVIYIILDNLDIKTFDVESLFERVQTFKKLLQIESINNCLDIQETNVIKTGLF